MFLIYGVNVLSGTLFYVLASLWFIKRRRSRLAPGIFVTHSLKKWGKPRA